MHEASIALSILEIAEEQCRNAGCTKIQSVSVNIGQASGVLPDALLMAFDIVKLETIANDARLLINDIPLGGSCHECDKGFTTIEPFILECPHCGGKDFVLDRGRELDITEIEAD
jgi:hydrogenase nickel incorporation protein HypA/HybF